jgi:hypothetical protein
MVFVDGFDESQLASRHASFYRTIEGQNKLKETDNLPATRHRGQEASNIVHAHDRPLSYLGLSRMMA